jgi:hypothetical protein
MGMTDTNKTDIEKQFIKQTLAANPIKQTKSVPFSWE